MSMENKIKRGMILWVKVPGSSTKANQYEVSYVGNKFFRLKDAEIRFNVSDLWEEGSGNNRFKCFVTLQDCLDLDACLLSVSIKIGEFLS